MKKNRQQFQSPPLPAQPPRASLDAISKRAYELWENEGRTHGNDRAHWYQAEKELLGHVSGTVDVPQQTQPPAETATIEPPPVPREELQDNAQRKSA